MPRIEPLPINEWPREMRAALAAMTPPNPRHPILSAANRPKGLNTLGACRAACLALLQGAARARFRGPVDALLRCAGRRGRCKR